VARSARVGGAHEYHRAIRLEQFEICAIVMRGRYGIDDDVEVPCLMRLGETLSSDKPWSDAVAFWQEGPQPISYRRLPDDTVMRGKGLFP